MSIKTDGIGSQPSLNTGVGTPKHAGASVVAPNASATSSSSKTPVDYSFPTGEMNILAAQASERDLDFAALEFSGKEANTMRNTQKTIKDMGLPLPKGLDAAAPAA